MLSPNFTGENHSRFGSKDMTEDFFNQQRGAANTHYISMKEGNNGIVTGLNSKKKEERNLSFKHDKKVEMLL